MEAEAAASSEETTNEGLTLESVEVWLITRLFFWFLLG